MLNESIKIELSELLSISKDKVDIISKSVFDNISKILLKATPFYIENIGTISIEDIDSTEAFNVSKRVRRTVFYAKEEKAYYSTESLALNMAILYKEDEQKIREIINRTFSYVNDTLTRENKISIQNFGDFYAGNIITFLPSFYLEYLINPYFNLTKNSKKIESVIVEPYENEIAGDIYSNKVIDNTIIDASDNSEEDIVEDLDDYDDILDAQQSKENFNKNIDDDLTEEIIEEVIEEVVETPESVVANDNKEEPILKYDEDVEKQIKEPFSRKPQKRSEGYEINVENKVEDKTADKVQNRINKKSYKNTVVKQKKERSWIFALISIAAIFIILSAIILMFYKNVLQEPSNSLNVISQILENDRPPKYQNNNMYDIAEFYFIRKGSQYKTYVLSRDMYYWEIANMVYGATIYWPFIYALNGDENSIINNNSFLVKKGQQVDVAELKQNRILSLFREMDKDVAQTLAELYFSLYNVFFTIGDSSKAMNMITISATLDRNILEQKKYEIPTRIYDVVSANVDHKRK